MDNDGLLDGEDYAKANPTDSDSDDDGLTDGEEVRQYSTDPLNPDSDDDGLIDRYEIFESKTDPNNPDTDGDGIIDSLDIIPRLSWIYILAAIGAVIFTVSGVAVAHISWGFSKGRRDKLKERRTKARERSKACESFYEREQAAILRLARAGHGWLRKDDVVAMGTDEQCVLKCLRKLGAKKQGDFYRFPHIEQEFAKK